MRLCLLFLLVTVSAGFAAETGPGGDRAFQDYAPEYLEIKAAEVRTTVENDWFSQGKSRIKIQAEVTQVYRSASGLRAGQRIQVEYARKNSVGFGDPQPTVPAEGALTVAFLRKSGQVYVPAARQFTFAPLTLKQLEQLRPRREPPVIASDPPAPAPEAEEAPAPPAAAADVQPSPEEPPPAPADDVLPSRD